MYDKTHQTLLRNLSAKTINLPNSSSLLKQNFETLFPRLTKDKTYRVSLQYARPDTDMPSSDNMELNMMKSKL